PDELLLQRLSASRTRRPLLDVDPVAALAELRRRRLPFYRAADHQVEASGSIEQVTATVAARLESERRSQSHRLFAAEGIRHHPMGPATTRVVYGTDLDAAAIHGILEHASDGAPLVVADERVAAALPSFIAAFPEERRLSVHAGERGKRLRAVESL